MTETTLDSLILAIEKACTPIELIGSAQALADYRSVDAIPALIAVLGYNNPGAAVTAMHGLIALGRVAVEPLLASIDDYNYGARAYSIRALARIGDPRSLDILLQSAETDFAPSVRRAAIKGLGSLRWDWTDWDIDTISQAQARALHLLESLLDDTDWSMRYAVIAALDKIASARIKASATRAIDILELARSKEADRGVKLRVQMALKNLLVAT